MASFLNKVRHAGHGKRGFKCPCCGPAPSAKKQELRRQKKEIKRVLDKVERNS